ncbi:MAG: HDOD domain-containing protein [Nocardioidaceae bacterium]
MSGELITVDRVVGRQPIIGHGDRVLGFQLMERTSTEVPRPATEGDQAITISGLLGELSFDIDVLFDDIQLFCRPSLDLLTSATHVARPVRRTVLEVPAELGAEPAIVARCAHLWATGYSIAAEVTTWDPAIEPLLKVSDVVIIDLSAASRDEVADLVQRCARFEVALLATRCQTEDDLAWARAAGFQLFQGRAVVHPVDLDERTLAPSVLAQVQLAGELLDERLDFGRVEEILHHEPGLVVQILHLASLGARSGLRREVHSIREALVVLGTQKLRQWAALTILGRQVGNARTDALAAALVRARMCELLAERAGVDHGFAFTAGLLSSLDHLLGVSLAEVEAKVDLDRELADAAFRREGPVGQLVRLVTEFNEAVADDEPVDAEVEQIEMVGAMAFAWALSHIHAMEQTPRAH